jgi:lysylphosphatidylglycerol synthetase-like protein (DUF2156 family)
MKFIPKYSLAYLFLEIFLFAVAFGLLRTFTGPAELTLTRAIIITAMSVCFCAGIGGLFKRMKWGAIGGVTLALAFMWFMLEP